MLWLFETHSRSTYHTERDPTRQDDVLKAPDQMEESMMMEKGRRGAGVCAWVHENCDINMACFGRVSASVCVSVPVSIPVP